MIRDNMRKDKFNRKIKLNPDIYIKSAELVSSDQNRFSCHAVFNEAISNKSVKDKTQAGEYEKLYQKTFKLNTRYGLRISQIDGKSTNCLKNFRILALLFMAEFVKTEYS